MCMRVNITFHTSVADVQPVPVQREVCTACRLPLMVAAERYGFTVRGWWETGHLRELRQV